MSVNRTIAGLSKEQIEGEVGQVLTAPSESRKGTLRFPAPVIGSDESTFICEDDVVAGDRVRVKDISGNSLIIIKH